MVGNIPSKFGHAKLLGSRIIRYVRDGRTDGRTKATLTAPSLRGGIIIKYSSTFASFLHSNLTACSLSFIVKSPTVFFSLRNKHNSYTLCVIVSSWYERGWKADN